MEPAPEGISIAIERPRVLAQERKSVAAVTAGDAAVVETKPGLIALLALRDSSGAELGAAFSAPWTVPLGAAASAADAAMGLSAPGAPNWTAWSYSMSWFRKAGENETLQALCRITQVTPQFIRYSIRVVGVECGKDLLVADGLSSASPVQTVPGAAPHVDSESPAGPIFAGFDSSLPANREPQCDRRTILLETRAPELVGAPPSPPLRVGHSSQWRISSGILELLMNPVQGRSEPLGRRSHPYSGIQIGAAIYAARRLLGDRYEPERGGARYIRSFSEPRGECALAVNVSAVKGSSYGLACRFMQLGEVLSVISLEMSPGSKTDAI
jgi:hypothetical protein